ncbi:hypothetical protein MP638_005564 [Amoeboaphelidium occidentale]|nr:hypothetical protein MP638_005564 [Amoeboaphelidium occidentale]
MISLPVTENRKRKLEFNSIHSATSSLHPTKFCRRHLPEAQKQEPVQPSERLISALNSQSDKERVKDVLSFYQSSSGQIREAILSGILEQSCIPQLTYLYNNLPGLLKVDILSLLPAEISIHILSLLDAKALCRAACVSKRWNQLANDSGVWHRICVQHIEKQCKKCGWGLPLMVPRPRATSMQSEGNSDDECSHLNVNWKGVYKSRLLVERNWRYRNFRTTILTTEYPVTCFQYAHDLLVAGFEDGSISVWHKSDMKLHLQIAAAHDGPVSALVIDKCKIFSSGLTDGLVKLWNLNSGECVREFVVHQSGVISLDFDGTFLVSGTASGVTRVCNIKASKCYTLNGHNALVNQVHLSSYSKSKTKLFTCSEDSKIIIWDTETMSIEEEVEHQNIGYTTCLKTSSKIYESTLKLDAPLLFTGGCDSVVRVFDTASGKQIKKCCAHDGSIISLDVDSLHLVTIGEDNNLVVWDSRIFNPIWNLEIPDGGLSCVSLSETCIFLGTKRGLQIFDFE